MITADEEANVEVIIAAKKQLLATRQKKTPNAAVVALAEMQARPKPILSTVTDGAYITVIGQITIGETYDPVGTALRYIRAGVDAVALFTDQRIYSNGIDDLLLLARGIPNRPVICRDYIFNEYNVGEVRSTGASSVVIYSSILERPQIRNLISITQRWKMSSILQVSNEEEMEYVRMVSPHTVAIGVFDDPYFDPKRDLPLLERLCPLVPFSSRIKAMGCLQTLDDVAAVLEFGVNAITVSQELIFSQNTYEQLYSLLERSTGT
jgi:indole-3-glycerol phosphate synthase / phosphoribosylanthranilate isomerase